MNSCGYCGRENDEQSAYCCECGTSLATTDGTAQQAALNYSQRRLDARTGTFILLLYVAVQFGVGTLTGLLGVSIAAVRRGGIHAQNDLHAITRTITGPAMAMAAVWSGVAMFLLSRAWIPQYLTDTSPTGAAWVFGPFKRIAQGLGIGALMACCYLALAVVFHHHRTGLGPLGTMAFTPGLQQLLWFLMALLVAPLVEEPLFRGVVYGGYRNSFGPVPAAVLSTAVFWLLHITEMIYFWPAMVAIAGVAAIALWFRLHSGAIGPAVAVHFGYNAVLALVVICSTL